MNWDAFFAITMWAAFLFIWLPRKHAMHRKRMKSMRAMNKGHRFKQKYKAIRSLNGRSS